MALPNADRYILGISGGKDSAALAVYMSDNYPHLNIEYFFTDTGEELPEVYDYLTKLEGRLKSGIHRLNSEHIVKKSNGKHQGPFEVYLEKYNYFLPSPQQRWCTSKLKILPLEKWIKPDIEKGKTIVSLVAIRADEPYREGQRSKHENYIVDLPFRRDGINRKGVVDLLNASGLGVPDYYKWRSRSGCTFCFFQRKIEWVRLKKNHPDAFERAKKIEKISLDNGSPFAWIEGETLEDLEKPARVKQIEENYEKNKQSALMKKKVNPLDPNELLDDDDLFGQSKFCISCHK